MNDIAVDYTGARLFEQINRLLVEKPHARAVHDFQAGVVKGIDLLLIQISITNGPQSSFLNPFINLYRHLLILPGQRVWSNNVPLSAVLQCDFKSS
jgi:hypothetical protein